MWYILWIIFLLLVTRFALSRAKRYESEFDNRK